MHSTSMEIRESVLVLYRLLIARHQESSGSCPSNALDVRESKSAP